MVILASVADANCWLNCCDLTTLVLKRICSKPSMSQRWTCSKQKALCDIAKIEKSQIFVYLKMKPLIKIFFACKCFKSCYGYFVLDFQSKFDLKKHRDTKITFCYSCINIPLHLVFFRLSMIQIWEINPWWTNSSVNGSREQAFTEITRYFCNNGTKIRKCVMKFD